MRKGLFVVLLGLIGVAVAIGLSVTVSVVSEAALGEPQALELRELQPDEGGDRSRDAERRPTVDDDNDAGDDDSGRGRGRGRGRGGDDDSSGPGSGDDDSSGPGSGDDDLLEFDDDSSGPGGGDDSNSGPG